LIRLSRLGGLNMALKLIVLSPEKTVLETECDRVTLPTTEGRITVLPHHIPLFTQIQQGELIAHHQGQEISLAVGGGFANINADKVVVLADFGISGDEIDEQQVRQARERAKQILESMSDEKTAALAQADLSRSLLQLKIATKRRRKV
jgi:F-type H+-transporting ATPase subunit epsilon